MIGARLLFQLLALFEVEIRSQEGFFDGGKIEARLLLGENTAKFARILHELASLFKCKVENFHGSLFGLVGLSYLICCLFVNYLEF